MRSKELAEALRLINKVLTEPRVGPDQGDQLRRAKRELETIARSGKVDAKRVFVAVGSIASVLQELVENKATH